MSAEGAGGGSSETLGSSSKHAFNCVICYGPASEPVVSFCGHLFCWKCCYEWISRQEVAGSEPMCPLCKGALNTDRLIPIYGTEASSASATAQFLPARPGAMRVPADTQPFVSWSFFPGVRIQSTVTTGLSFDGPFSFQTVFRQTLTEEAFCFLHRVFFSVVLLAVALAFYFIATAH